MSEAEIITGARAFLRANLTGTIGFDEEFIPIKIVVAPDGALVAPVMVAMLRALDVVIFLPAEDDAAMQLQVTLEEIQDSGQHAALCDRWRIYHGEPEDVRWARISIDAAKFDGRMFDGLALMEPNALAEAEPHICRKVNAEMRGLLKKACLRVAEVEIEDPRLVGVDPLGFDVRGRFDVVRLDANPEIVDDADAFAALEELAADTEPDGDASNT
jgi:hypothetical protein